MDTTLSILYVVIQLIHLIKSHNYSSKIVFAPSELSGSSVITNNTLKLFLRYGFHQTSECQIFEKTYLCIQKCLDLNYDVASSDKYCFCTCYIKKEKSKYSSKISNITRWKLGAPTTSKPAWAQKNMTAKLDLTKTTTGQDIQFTDASIGNNTSSIANSTETNADNATIESNTANPYSTNSFTNETSAYSDSTTGANTVSTDTGIP